MQYILTCVRAAGNPDALNECLYGLSIQETPAGVVHLIAVFDTAGGQTAAICNYWSASSGRRLVRVGALGLEGGALDEVIRDRVKGARLDYVAILDETHAPREGWLQAMYDATSTGADAITGGFAYGVPWASSPRITMPRDSSSVMSSNTILRAAWLADDWAATPRRGRAKLGAVTIFAEWHTLSWRQAWCAGWAVGRLGPRYDGAMLAQLAHGLGRLAYAPIARARGYCASSCDYLVNVALGELGEVAGAICAWRR